MVLFYFTSSDFPVISFGCSRPISSMRVGAISARQPPSLNLQDGSAPRMRMDFTEMLVRVVSFPWVNPQEKRQATAPAVMAAAMEEPVFRVREMELDGGTASRTALSVCRGRREVPGKIPGPCTLTPGAARSGLICPVAVKPRLLWM